MAEKIINNWIHIPGKHCASSALCDLMRFYNYELTEPECFGLGEGIGFWYIEGLNPSRMMHFRSADIEKRFFENIGFDFEWNMANSKEEIRAVLIESINKGVPVLLRTDIFYLDYYQSKTHFPGHVVILWGYDIDNNIAYVSDTERKGLTRCGFDSLLEGIMHGNFPEGELPHFKPITKPVFDLNKKRLFTRAAISNASTMLQNNDFDGYGVKGIQLASKKVLEWKELPDWKWLARFAYQVIEKRGTGGGGFRKMYANFLESFANKKVVSMMKQIASRWTDVAVVFKQISESAVPDFSMVSDMLWIQSIKEEEFFKSITG